MRLQLHITILLFLPFCNFAQTDTLNRVDESGKKQGYWKVHYRKVQACDTTKIYEEGRYLDNRKTGIWKAYYCNGTIKGILTYKNGRPEGPCKMFHENGKISEEGYWRANRWIGNYKIYDTLGNYKEYFFDTVPKKISGGYVNLYPKNFSDTISGKQIFYNAHKQKTKEGTFKDGRLIDGKAYIYDENGILQRIAIYREGKYIGDAEID